MADDFYNNLTLEELKQREETADVRIHFYCMCGYLDWAYHYIEEEQQIDKIIKDREHLKELKEQD